MHTWIHEIHVSEDFLIPVESSIEASYAAHLISLGAAIIKPVCMPHTTTLLSKIGFPIQLHFDPDFIVIWGNQSVKSLQVREVRGFSIETNAPYDRLLEKKAISYTSIKTPFPFKYEEVDGTKLGPAPDYTGPESWPSTKWEMEAPFDISKLVPTVTPTA